MAKKTGSSTPRTTAQRKKKMLAALDKSMGVVTDAVKISGIPSRTHYDWLKSDPDYAEAVATTKEIQIDFAESALMNRIKDGSDASIIFYLKTQARHRGYVERQNITVGTEQPFIVAPEQKGLSDTIKRIEDGNEIQND